MIGLNSTERIKQAIKDLNDPLPDDAYSVDELVEYKKWYSQAAKNKLQISQTCKDWFEGVFALLIPYGVDYYKTKYRDTSLYNIKPVNFSIDILKEIAGFAKHLEQDVNEIIYNNLIRRINQKEMTKLKEVNTYTLEELKWYKFWYDSRAVIKPSLDSKFKEALDEESKTEIEFDLDDLKLIKSGADNYYNYCVRDDYKMSIEEDDILDKLDARISFLRKKIIHQHTKDVSNSPVESFTEDEETVSNAYVDKQEEIWVKNHICVYAISDIYWINKWCENILKVTDSLAYKCRDASKEIFKLTGKLPEATRDNSIVSDNSNVSIDVFFSLKELKEIRNYASMYYSSNEKTVGARNTLYDINLRIKYLEGEEKMKKATELESVSDCKVEDTNAFIMCECRGIATGMCDIELRLSNVIRECIKHGYDVEYKYNDNCISKGYIQSGEMIHNLKNNTVFFKIEFVSTNDDCEFDIYSKNLDLKAIRFDDKTNTLHLQQNA